jgi:predicted nucleic acid-binding protein
MKNAVYVDTGFWIALIDAKDARHDNAKKIFARVFNDNEIVTSETIIGETVTYLNCSLKRHDLAVAFLDHLDTAPLRLLADDSNIRVEARAILRRYADSRLSYADCVSFALMTRHSVNRFVGYDKHFAVMGFQPAH